jgi:negative regulator of sigma E activity
MMKAQNAVRIEETASEEWLSVLMDGEMADDEARSSLGRLAKDTDAMRSWLEYGLIGDAMRGCVYDTSALDQRIKAALAAEPTILAPVAKPNRQPIYWVAAAAAVVVISWTVLSVAPSKPGIPVASNSVLSVPQSVQPSPAQATAAEEVASNEVMPYLVAHQDYAFTVGGEPDMHITPVSLAGVAQ